MSAVDSLDDRLSAALALLTAPGARFEVGTACVRGAQTRVFVNCHSSLREVWLDTKQFGSRDCLIYERDRITYEEAHSITSSFGAWLWRQGVRPGDRVAIAMRNYPEWMLAYWACVSIGVTVVGLNAWWVSEELTVAIEQCNPKVLVCDEERLERLKPWWSKEQCTVVAVRTAAPAGATSWNEVVTQGGALPAVEVDPDSDACIFFTSGTTGRSKGARLTHRGCANNVMNMLFLQDLSESSKRMAGEAPVAAPPYRALATTPLFHVTANNGAAHTAASIGGTLVLMYKWEPKEALRLIEAERITVLVGVPIMLRECLQHPDAAWRDLTSLVSASGGGAPMPPNLDEWSGGRSETSLQFGVGYGMTETTGAVAAITGEALRRRPGSCGRIVPTFEARIVDESGCALEDGSAGELCVRGSGVIPGYLGQPLDHSGPSEGGWLSTGDIARFDDQGYLYIVDRKKDMILRGGENVYCAEVEAALLGHAGVAEACAFAVEDERLGEEVGAVVVLNRGHELTADDLIGHAKLLLARYKVPRYLWVSPTPLPRNATGKFLRRKIKEDFRAADTRTNGRGG